MANENTTLVQEGGENGYGVLLYYKYFTCPIPDLQHLYDFYSSNCTSLSLLGRVRLSPNGVNATVLISVLFLPLIGSKIGNWNFFHNYQMGFNWFRDVWSFSRFANLCFLTCSCYCRLCLIFIWVMKKSFNCLGVQKVGDGVVMIEGFLLFSN